MENLHTNDPIRVPSWSLSRFNAIRFQRNPQRSDSFGLKLPGKGFGWVDECQVREAFKLFWVAHPDLDPMRKHTTRAICIVADPQWDERSETERRRIGRCFRYFADQRIVPLAVVAAKWPPLQFLITAVPDELRKAA